MTEYEIKALRQDMEVLTHDELFAGIMLQRKQIDTLNSDTARLKGEAKVLRDLLALALDVLHTIAPESAPEDEALDALTTSITAALKGPQ